MKNGKIKSIFEILDKNSSGRLDDEELKPNDKTLKQVAKISPLLAMQMRNPNFNIHREKRGKKKKGIGLSEFEKIMAIKKNKDQKQTKKPRTNIELIKQSRKNYAKSVNVFNPYPY